MTRLPVIIGFGGINAAGRSSGHQAYRRMIIDHLGEREAAETWQSLVALMGLNLKGQPPDGGTRDYIQTHTLVRRIERDHFDAGHVPCNRRLKMRPADDEGLRFVTRVQHLPMPVPDTWQVRGISGGEVEVRLSSELELLLPGQRLSEVNAAGQLPSGFDPRTLYPARSHPRGLQMTVYGASDAVQSLGFDWEAIRNGLPPDQVSVYAGSGMGQLDGQGSGGMLYSRANASASRLNNARSGLPKCLRTLSMPTY